MVLFYKYGDGAGCDLRVTFFIVFMIFFIIGCSTWFSGCDPELSPMCFRFYVKDTTVYDYQVSTRQCSTCTSYHTVCYDDDDGQTCYDECNSYIYYECYDSFALTQYYLKGDNETCMLQVSNDVTNSTTALLQAQSKYPIGKMITMYIEKSNLRCFTTGEGEIIAVVGVIFLSLAGLVVFLNWIEVNFFAGPGGLSPAEQAEEDAANARAAEVAALEAKQEKEIQERRALDATANAPPIAVAYVPYSGNAAATVASTEAPPSYEMTVTHGANVV